jgi:hypothetical protein
VEQSMCGMDAASLRGKIGVSVHVMSFMQRCMLKVSLVRHDAVSGHIAPHITMDHSAFSFHCRQRFQE